MRKSRRILQSIFRDFFDFTKFFPDASPPRTRQQRYVPTPSRSTDGHAASAVDTDDAKGQTAKFWRPSVNGKLRRRDLLFDGRGFEIVAFALRREKKNGRHFPATEYNIRVSTQPFRHCGSMIICYAPPKFGCDAPPRRGGAGTCVHLQGSEWGLFSTPTAAALRQQHHLVRATHECRDRARSFLCNAHI